MVKQLHGAWLPDREDYYAGEIALSPQFARGPTVQFKKFAAAFPHIRRFRHAVDVGSNIGLWTRTFAACFERVTCFEPNPETSEAFWLNQSRSRFVELHQIALGAEPAMVTINRKLRSTTFTRIDAAGDLVVEQRTLDSFNLEDVDFVKMDVEGWEHNVVKGAKETIHRCRPTMILEQKPDNAERHGLKQFGAVNLCKKWGMRQVAEISGDVVMAW